MTKKILVIGYLVGSILLCIYSIATENQPALFWIDMFAPNVGDEYDIKIVFGLTLLTCFIPLIFFMGLSILFQNRRNNRPVAPDETGVWINRKKQLQSALISIPIYINQEKAGAVNMGQKIFFGASSINLYIQAGKGKGESLPFEYELKPGEQLHLELELVPDGLFTRNVLRELVK